MQKGLKVRNAGAFCLLQCVGGWCQWSDFLL